MVIMMGGGVTPCDNLWTFPGSCCTCFDSRVRAYHYERLGSLKSIPPNKKRRNSYCKYKSKVIIMIIGYSPRT